MKLTPPLTKMTIVMQETGFYSGFNQIVVITSKILLALVVYGVWSFLIKQALF